MKRTISIIIIAIIVTTAIGLGLYLGSKAIYDAGVNDGRNEMSDEVSLSVKALGTAVSEKESFQKELGNAFAEVPTELNTEGIDGYIEKLTGVIERVNNEDAKTVLNKYLEKWQAFKDVYAGKQNTSIEEKFNELKTTSIDVAKQLKAVYDDWIRNAIQAL